MNVPKILQFSFLILTFQTAAGLGQLETRATAAERTFFVPQFGHGSLQGNQFSSSINLINLSTTLSAVTIATFSEAGDPLNLLDNGGMAVNTIGVTIPGRGRVGVNSLNADPDNSLDAGYVTVTTQNAVGVQVLFNIIDPGGALSSTNVRSLPIVTAASFFGDINLNFNTAVALLNPVSNGVAVDVELTLFDSTGAQIGSRSVPLDPGQRTSRFLDELVPGLQNFSGTVELRSNSGPDNVPISILPLRQEGTVLTTQDVFPPRQFP